MLRCNPLLIRTLYGLISNFRYEDWGGGDPIFAIAEVNLAKSAVGRIAGRVQEGLLPILRLFRLPLGERWLHRAIEALPSRLYLQEVLIPALAGAGRRRMLFVGVQSYNLPVYRSCAEHNIAVWSVDYDPASAIYGAPQGHFVGDVEQIAILAPSLKFDVIIFNGILGFGVNTPTDATAALDAMEQVAEPDALLIVGWNPGRTDDLEIIAVRARLTPTPLGALGSEIEFPPHGRLQRGPHRYEIFKLSTRNTQKGRAS
jgi:hypothetical protein